MYCPDNVIKIALELVAEFPKFVSGRIKSLDSQDSSELRLLGAMDDIMEAGATSSARHSATANLYR